MIVPYSTFGACAIFKLLVVSGSEEPGVLYTSITTLYQVTY